MPLGVCLSLFRYTGRLDRIQLGVHTGYGRLLRRNVGLFAAMCKCARHAGPPDSRSLRALVRFLFVPCALVAVLLGCAQGRPVPNVADTQAWLTAGVPVGSSKADTIKFLKTHLIQGLSAQSDYKVRPYEGQMGQAPRVILAGIFPDTPYKQTHLVWCTDQLLISFDRNLRVANRSVHQECVGP